LRDQSIEGCFGQVDSESDSTDGIRHPRRRIRPWFTVDVSEPLERDDGRADGNLEGGGDLGVGIFALVTEDIAVHVTPAPLDVVVEADEGVHQRLARARARDERALALDPL